MKEACAPMIPKELWQWSKAVFFPDGSGIQINGERRKTSQESIASEICVWRTVAGRRVSTWGVGGRIFPSPDHEDIIDLNKC